MSLIISGTNEQKKEPLSEGLHQAVCVAVVDLGTQYNKTYGKYQPKIMLTWEILDETIEINGEDLPRNISKPFTCSMSEKSTLRKMLRSWRGREFNEAEMQAFDLRNVLGKGCQLSILHREGTDGTKYANVDNIVNWPKGLPVPVPHGELISFDIDSLKDGEEALLNLPEWLQSKIKESEEWKALQGGQDFPDWGEEDFREE